MKQYIIKFCENMALQIISFIILFIGFSVVMALNYPTEMPIDETPGGMFMSYFNKMLVDTDINTTNGMVKTADSSITRDLTDNSTHIATTAWVKMYCETTLFEPNDCTPSEKTFSSPKRLNIPLEASQRNADEFCKQEGYSTGVILSTGSASTTGGNGTARWNNSQWLLWANTTWIKNITCSGCAIEATSYYCTGGLPTNSGRWNANEDEGLTGDLERKYVNVNTSRKCEYGCIYPYVWNGSSCAN